MLIHIGFGVWSHRTLGRPACQRAEAEPSPAPAEPRGSAGHAWSAGFDWAAVVVETGRRHRSGQTVPGAARSPLPTLSPPFPVSPTDSSREPTAPPMASAPVRTCWGGASRQPVLRAAGQGRGRSRTWREVEAGVRSRVLNLLAPGARVSPSAPGALGSPSPGRAPGRSSPRLGARD